MAETEGELLPGTLARRVDGGHHGTSSLSMGGLHSIAVQWFAGSARTKGHVRGFLRDNTIFEVYEDLMARKIAEANYYCVEAHGRRFQLAKDSLFVFREEFPTLQSWRYWAVWFTEWDWFEKAVVLLIGINSVVLALPVAYTPDTASQSERDFLTACNLCTIFVFTVECILKIIARGLIFSLAPDPCYLTDPLNWLDLFVVISSWLELTVMGDRFDNKYFILVRALRVMRPLRTIRALPHLRMMVTTLLDSGTLMVHWVALTCFLFTIFAIIGNNLFSTTYWQRCRLTPAPILVNDSLTWPIDPSQRRFCGGRYKCQPTAAGNQTWCGSPVSVAEGAIDGYDVWAELSASPIADFGTSGFQSYQTSIMTVFQVSTQEGWTGMLYRYQDGSGTIVATLFFVGVLLLGGFVLMNLLIAILWDGYSQIVDKETPMRLDLTYHGEHIPDDILKMKFSGLVREVLMLETKNSKVDKKKQNQTDLGGLGLKSVCYSICVNPHFTNGMLAIIIMNSAILASDSYPPLNPGLQSTFETINLLCSMLFVVEVLIKMVGMGITFFGDYFNLFDLFLASASLYEIFISGEAAIAALRIAKLLRVFKFIGVNDSVRVLLRVLKRTVMPTSNFSFLVALLVYVLGLLGLQFFHEPRDDEPYFNFTSLVWAVVTVFALIVGQDWNSIMVSTLGAQGQHSLVVLFHLLCYILGHLILINLFTAMFVVAFSRARDELLVEFRNRLYALRFPEEEIQASPPSARTFVGSVDPEESEVDSPLWPEDAQEHRLHFVWAGEEEDEPALVPDCHLGPERSGLLRQNVTMAYNMNILKMMHVKQAAACRKWKSGEKVTFRPTIDGLDGTSDSVSSATLAAMAHHHHHRHHTSSAARTAAESGDSKEEVDGWDNAADEEGPQRPPALTMPQSTHLTCPPPDDDDDEAAGQADDEAPPRQARAIAPTSKMPSLPLRVAADGEGPYQNSVLGVARLPTAATTLPPPVVLPQPLPLSGECTDLPSRLRARKPLLTPLKLEPKEFRGTADIRAKDSGNSGLRRRLPRRQQLTASPKLNFRQLVQEAKELQDDYCSTGGLRRHVPLTLHSCTNKHGMALDRCRFGELCTNRVDLPGTTAESWQAHTQDYEGDELAGAACWQEPDTEVQQARTAQWLPEERYSAPPPQDTVVVVPASPQASGRDTPPTSPVLVGSKQIAAAAELAFHASPAVPDAAKDEITGMLMGTAQSEKPVVAENMWLQIVHSPAFDPLILSLILISSLLLALESPFLEPGGKLAILLQTVDIVAVVVFTFEMVVRMMAYGICKPTRSLPPGSPGPYFQVAWNWIDFCAVVTALLDFIMTIAASNESSLKILRALRVVRVLRPLRLLKTYPGIRIIVEGLLRSLPTLANLIIITFLFYLGFGILFVNLLKGQLWHCSLDPRGNIFPEIENRAQCEQHGGEWVNNPSNFDHVGRSMLTLFHMSTGEGWLETLACVVDSRGVDLQPRKYARVHLIIPLIGFISLSNFFILNLFIGVLADHFMLSKAELNKVDLLDAAHRLWMDMQRDVFLNPNLLVKSNRLSLARPTASGIRRCAQIIVESKPFDLAVLAVILANTLMLCMSHPTQSKLYHDTTEIMSLVFVAIFNIEAILKLIAHRRAYFKDSWNILDFVIVIGSDVGVIVDVTTGGEGVIAQILRGFRVVRVLRMARHVKFLQIMLESLSRIMPGLVNVSLLLALMIFIYAIVGVGLFGTIADGGALGENANFHSFDMAMMTLLRASTGEQWHLLMFDLRADKPGCTREDQTSEELERDGPRGCGSILAYPFFVTFEIMVNIVVANLIVAVVVSGFSHVREKDSLDLFHKQVAMLVKEWQHHDVPWTGFLDLQKAVDILLSLPPPVGFKGSKRKHVLHRLRLLRLFQDTNIHIRDVMMICAQRAYLWMREEPESDTENVRFDSDVLVAWMGAFPDVPYPEMYAKNCVVIAHVIIAAHVMRFVKKKRHEWKIAKLDRQARAEAEEKAREEAKKRPVSHLTIDTGDSFAPQPRDTGAGVGDLGAEEPSDIRPKGMEPLPAELQQWDPKAAATPSVLVTQLTTPNEYDMPQLSPLPWPPLLTPSRK